MNTGCHGGHGRRVPRVPRVPECQGALWAAGERGYLLVEMLVSAAIVCTVLGVVLSLAAAAQASVRAAGEAADLQQRLRVAVEALRRDLLAAGAGPSAGPGAGPLNDVFAPVLPLRSGRTGADPDLSAYTDRISLLYVPRGASETALTRGMTTGGGPLIVDGRAPGCPGGNVCGFHAGDRVLVYSAGDAEGWRDVFTILAADTALGAIVPAAPLSRPYPAGARVVSIVQRIYYLDRPGRRLMVYDGDRSDVPVVDHVVDLRFAYDADPAAASATPPATGRSNCAYAAGDPPVPRLEDLGGIALVRLASARMSDGPVCGGAGGAFDADLLRVRRIVVSLRLEAEGDEFRGSGPAFANPGTSREASRYVPDVELAFSVAPRNMGNTALR